MNNEPVAWTKKDTLIFLGNYKFGSITIQVQKQKDDEFGIPLYTHPAKTQLSNGHLSDCAIHNEPASKNKNCNCGFEPKFDLSGLKHEDNCRYFDDSMFCTCGSNSDALVEWYRHKEVTHTAKTLTDEEIYACFHQYFVLGEPKPTHYELEYEDLIEFARAILRKAQEK